MGPSCGRMTTDGETMAKTTDNNDWMTMAGTTMEEGGGTKEISMGGQVTTLAYVYSFGMLLLQMFTKKRPIDEAFIDGLSIRSFVARAFPQRAKEIVDPCLLVEDDEEIND